MIHDDKKMGLMGLTTIVAVSMMGSGIVMLPASMAQIGAVSLLSWVVTALGSMAIAYCFAQLGVFCHRPGGMSAYSEEAHGKSSFFMASYLYYLSQIIGNVAVAIAAIGYATPFFPWLGSGSTPLLIGTVGLLWMTTFANFGGPSVTGRIGSVTVWGVIIPVAGLSVIGWFWFKPDVFAEAWNPHNVPMGDAIARSIPLTLWCFLGMEAAAQNSMAVKDPKKNVPLACLFGTLGAAVVYVLSTTVMQGIVPNADLANSSAPFAYVYAQMFNPTVGKIIMGLAVLACVGSLLGWQFTISMVAKATADERLFPQFYSKVNRHGAPVIGLMVAAVLQTFTAASTASPNASEVFNQLVNLTAVTILIPYITSISALMVVMRKAEVSESLYRINLVAVFVSMAYCFYALYASGIQAVFGATLVMMVGYLLFGFVAYRFVVAENPAPRGVSPG
jgi:putrescine:ornithine antiporter